MFPEERKEGSPRFAKLHFPVGLWVNNPRKRLAQIRHRWPSAASVRSNSSDSAEPRQHGKAKAARHKRLSNLFLRANSAPQGSNVTPQGSNVTPQGSAAAPHGSKAAPQSSNRHWVSEDKLPPHRAHPADLHHPREPHYPTEPTPLTSITTP